MRITIKKLKEFKKMGNKHRKALFKRFVDSNKIINNQNTVEIKVIAEYNFWGGYEYAILKVLQYMKYQKDKNGGGMTDGI